MAQFGGGQATYSFEYLATSFERQGFVTSLCSSETPTITLQALHRIVQPDGSFYEMQYYPTDNEGEVLSAAIRSLRHPTGGEMRWTYTEHIVSSQSMEEPGPPGPNPKSIQKAFGVATKEVALTVGGAATGTWVYTYHSDFGVTAPGEVGIACHRRPSLTLSVTIASRILQPASAIVGLSRCRSHGALAVPTVPPVRSCRQKRSAAPGKPARYSEAPSWTTRATESSPAMAPKPKSTTSESSSRKRSTTTMATSSNQQHSVTSMALETTGRKSMLAR